MLMVMGINVMRAVTPIKEGNQIAGHVIEKDTEEHLPYATILVIETGSGTVSDDSGHFVFKNVKEGTYTLRVQLMGYAPRKFVRFPIWKFLKQ